MGSVVMTDILTDTTPFPHTMLGGNGHQSQQSERGYPPSSSPHGSQPPSSHTQTHISRPTSITSSAQERSIRSPAQSTLSEDTPFPATGTAPIPVPSARAKSGQYVPQGAPIRQQFPTQQHITRPLNDVLLGHQATPPQVSSVPPQPREAPPSGSGGSPNQPPPRSVAADGPSASPNRIKVRDLAHIQSFATEEFLKTSSLGQSSRRGPTEAGPQYEISSMPVEHIIEMVAGLLTKITTTNDRQHEHLHRHIPPPDGTAGLSQQSSSVLAFHGKNVPTITIMSYLSRIHKYCPTTYEVFLSLLVYFDRMTERVNSGPMQNMQKARRSSGGTSDIDMTDAPGSPGPRDEFRGRSDSRPSEASAEAEAYNLSHFFVVDSFNIHRLVIAGVTCASKFFSDVFYTNSRYAKVGFPSFSCSSSRSSADSI
jgi:hypothetical protein